MSLHIFKGNSKLRGLFHKYRIWGVNLPPVLTCRKNAPCITKCYACKGTFVFKSVKLAHMENLMLYRTRPEEFERQIIEASRRRGHWRWHSSGDIVDMPYLDMMYRIARACPNTKYLCFTKQYEIVNEYFNTHDKLDNLTIVFSVWGDLIPENPHNFPLAFVKFADGESYIPEGAHHCPGYCGDCVFAKCNCWDLKPGEAVYFDEH